MNRIKQVNETYLLTVAAAVGASVVIAFVSAVLGMAGIVTDELMTLLISQLFFFLPTGVYLWRNKFDLRETIRLKPIKITTVFMLVGFMYSIMPMATLINVISLKFTTNVIDATITNIAANYPLAVGVVVVALIPAVLEESVYRGVFYNEYRKVDIKKAIVLSGFLFGITHMNLNQFIYAFLLGMVFSVVVEVTDSIVSSMVLHFVMNGTSMVSVYAQGMASAETAVESVDTAGVIDIYIQSIWMPAIAGVVLSYFILKGIAGNEGRSSVLRELFGRKNAVSTDELEVEETVGYPEKQLGTVALWIGIAFSVGIMFLVELTK